jgi:hypothetical protein
MSDPRLSIIPAGAVTDRSLEPRDLQVLCLLGRHTDKLGWCFRSQVKMAEEIDCGRASLQRSLERLYEAGWVEKRLRSAGAGTPDPKHPHAAHAYRVILDRDDLTGEFADEASHEENAEQAPGCPPVGTPPGGAAAADTAAATVPENGHPGAHPSAGTGCPPIAGHMNDPLERPILERERDARARDRDARGLVVFEARWPTAAADDRQRTAYAWAELDGTEREAAMQGIAPFLENLKRLGRKNVPAGWKYLEEKRWTLLEKAKTEPQTFAPLPSDSDEAKAVTLLYTLAGKGHAVGRGGFMRLSDGAISYRREITPQLRALAQAPQGEWPQLDRQQARAWSDLIDAYVAIETRRHLDEGDRAPWPWPPSKEGKIYASTGPPPTLCSDADLDEFAKTG